MPRDCRDESGARRSLSAAGNLSVGGRRPLLDADPHLRAARFKRDGRLAVRSRRVDVERDRNGVVARGVAVIGRDSDPVACGAALRDDGSPCPFGREGDVGRQGGLVGMEPVAGLCSRCKPDGVFVAATGVVRAGRKKRCCQGEQDGTAFFHDEKLLCIPAPVMRVVKRKCGAVCLSE